ncbi:hypothetical protein [Legionella parisiensis]|uniref:Legionella ubiquitin-specific protease A domain-containing protein n=1 Tax=Legionella parisiensis TaxID=45071 RepID=A0A1E5JMW5_9GAMM|nr:hypothetical protein [Legionella parisiensis]KTD44356.1 substrate of the Dot/Icm secretion system [Legionella parisiensis]OEH45885.1 hypothetical protein lpari_03073 [Legionella parisiensis]STX71982.1 Dot/Icm secretion system substrate [Legionella parisiensis]
MALSEEYRNRSLENFIKRYKKKLTVQSNTLLDAINKLAATYDVPLGFQSDEVIKLVGKQLDKPFDESSLQKVAASIYSMVIEQNDRETHENRRKHRAVGRFDLKYIHQRSLKDQLQDHDMALLMPQSHGNIEVLGPINRFDPGSVGAAREGLDLALKNKRFDHIFIPVGPGHWRGIYLTKPVGGKGKYQVELFDPYGPGGASAIEEMTLELLKHCGIDASQVTIKTAGPIHPQKDMYACGDFTCAYSHKKMKELGAPRSAYNQDFIAVLDSRGNKEDSLRYASRDLSATLAKSKPIIHGEEEEIEEEVEFSEDEKRKFLIRLGQLLSDPNKMDKAVLEGNVAKIKDTFGKSKSASLRELDAYGVFNADGSINKDIAARYQITFAEHQIKTRLESYGFKHLSLREMIIFESAIRSVINDLSHDQHINSNQPSKGLAKQCFADFLPPTMFRLANPLGMELTGPTRQMIGMGYLKFKDANVSMSPGPSAARSLTPETNPELYEAEHDIARYLTNLLTNNVAHVFAVGRVFPYYPQEDSGKREIRTDEALNDFINYFIPDANGRVTLPDIPELEDIHITSRPIKKVGRFITYEISINGSAPIQVHHFPLRDKQPLELTPQELSYVKKIGQSTPPEQNIHAHCRKGKGRSAQIAYLLASLNPKYGQLNSEERLAQMRAEKTPRGKPEYFIETDLQEDYIEKDGYLIQENNDSEIPLEEEEENLELYLVYGTLLKQEIDQLLQQIDIPKQIVAETDHAALLQLMEKYQELSSLAPEELPVWVEEVCKNPIVTEHSLALFESIKNSTDFLLHAFAERRNLDELEMFFDLQARHGGYLETLDKLSTLELRLSDEISSREKSGEITHEEAQIEQETLDKYTFSFVSRLQDSYLENWEKISEEDKAPCIVEGRANIVEVVPEIFNALMQHNPETFTKADFKALQKKYYKCKQRIELLEKVDLLEKAKGQDNFEVLAPELKQQIKTLEKLFALGYDHFAVETAHITEKMRLIYEELSELFATGVVSPKEWNDLKNRFANYKTLFALTNQDEIATPQILLTLDNLFQEKREHTIPLSSLFIWRVLEDQPQKGNLEDFVAGLGYSLIDTLFEDLPPEYYGVDADGIYSEEINLLIEDILKLAATKKTDEKKGAFKLTDKRPPLPTPEEYEEAKREVIELIEQRLPYLITSTHFKVRIENLAKDFSHLGDLQLSSPEWENLKKRFAELKLEYQSHPKSELIEQLLGEMELRFNEVVEPVEEDTLIKQHRESMENVLRIKAIRSAAAREVQDEIPFFESRIEQKIPKLIGYPKLPKLIVFNIDAVLAELNNGEMIQAQELINVLNYAKKYGMEVALACSHMPSSDNGEQSTFAQLRVIIEKNTKIDISHMVLSLDTIPLHHEKATTSRYFQRKIAQLTEQINLLKSQLPTEEELEELKRQFPEERERDELEKATKKLQSKKEQLEETILKLQAELDSLPVKSAKLTSDTFLHLDAIRHHYALTKPSNDINYYQMVEGGILADFKTPELFGGVARGERWDNLFQLAEVIMGADYPQVSPTQPSTARPSLQAILKDLIINADNPRLLQKKYGSLARLEDAIQQIQEHKEYLHSHIPQIEAFYQSRLAYRKKIYEAEIYKKAVLNEEDVVFFDSHQKTINLIHQQSNYRAIKVNNGEEKPFRHIVDLHHEMGVYNGLIAYLKGDEEHAPKHYGPGRINKTLGTYLTTIPDFTLYEFQDSPIVLHLEMSAILDKLPELSAEEEVQQRYKDQFFEAAIERFKQLSEASKIDLVKTYYRDKHQALNDIKEELKKLISSSTPQLGDKLTELQTQVDTILEMDKKFSQHISPTFLGAEAKLLRAMITEGLDSESLDHLEVDADKVKLKADHDISRSQFYIESIMEDPDTYLRGLHPALEELDVFDKAFITEQYTHYIEKHLKKIIQGDYSSLQAVLDVVQQDVTLRDPEKNDALIKNHLQLIAAKRLCEKLLPIIPYQTRVDELTKEPQTDYFEQVSELSGKITNYIDQIESSDEYRAKLFLDKADKYLRTRNWDVGFQWNKHTIFIGGKEKKIPATVAQQLEVIEQARTDANYSYLEAKKAFLEIGKQKEITWRSSKVARNYYSLFKKPDDTTLEKDLDTKFSPTSKT